MSLFRDLGERVERFKQQAVDASEEHAEYVCRSCEKPVYAEQTQCPHCGSEELERVVSEESAPQQSENGARETSESVDRSEHQRTENVGAENENENDDNESGLRENRS